MPVGRCRDCCFFFYVGDRTSTEDGQCRRRAPLPSVDSSAIGIKYSRWPRVEPHDGCGEWEIGTPSPYKRPEGAGK